MHTHFGRSQAMSVGDGKDGSVALGLDGREKALHFLLGEEGDGAVLFSFREPNMPTYISSAAT